MRHSIANFKYHSKKEYAKFYIEEMLQLYGTLIQKLAPDVIVPIPIHRSKHLDRGYNQADILARGLGEKLNIPVSSQLLIRNKKTLPQKKLSDKERLLNLQEAFQMNETVAKCSSTEVTKVLLVDDIYTTGSTIEACTNVLKSNGIKEVYFIVLCIGKGF
jgi:ComF family protein